MIINRSELTFKKRSTSEKVYQKLKFGDLELDPCRWKINEDTIEPCESCFKWNDWFVNDLMKMAKASVAGEIETIGEGGEYTKYVLRDGKVEEYNGEVVYPKTPSAVHRHGE